MNSRSIKFSRFFSSAVSSTSRVETTIKENGIAHVTLNRPDKLNALDVEMFKSIEKAAIDLQSNKSVRAVILSGKGKAFCTGLDIKSVMKNPIATTNQLLAGRDVENNKIGNLAQNVAILWRKLPVPVFCVLHGMCFGGGMQIALGADFRYATPDCKLSIMEGKWGLIPDMGITITLREVIKSIDVAKELTMTARIVSGQEAKEIGLVTHVFDDPLQHAEDMANAIVNQQSPDSIASTKQLYQKTWLNANELECLELETKLQMKLLKSWNQKVAVSRNALGWKLPYISRSSSHDDEETSTKEK